MGFVESFSDDSVLRLLSEMSRVKRAQEAGVDVGALLELADELEHVALEGDNNGDELVLSRGAAFYYSRRIREALGVVE